MSKEYVTKINGAYRIGETRVSLDSIVCSWLQEDSPETIVDNFPSVTLEQAYGAIAFYRVNGDEVENTCARVMPSLKDSAGNSARSICSATKSSHPTSSRNVRWHPVDRGGQAATA